jgi:hypothetical protein
MASFMVGLSQVINLTTTSPVALAEEVADVDPLFEREQPAIKRAVTRTVNRTVTVLRMFFLQTKYYFRAVLLSEPNPDIK